MSESNPPRLPQDTVLHVRDTCLCLHAQRAARALARRFDEVLRPFGLTNGQFSLLMTLNQPKAPQIGQLAHFLAMDRTTLTAALKPLDRRGLLHVATDENDRRSRVVSITANGVALLEQAIPVWRAAHDRLEKALNPGEPHVLRASLNRLAWERDATEPAPAEPAAAP